MALHIARSDRGEGCRKEGHDQMVLAIIFIEIADQPIMSGRKRKIEDLFTHQRSFLLRRKGRNREKKDKK
jgi:hypothetical protein